MFRRLACVWACGWILAGGGGLIQAASTVETLGDDVCVVRDDQGRWGDGSQGITHQRGSAYYAKKILDLGDVPEAVWRDVSEVRLSAFFCIRDYSVVDLPKPNGLDESLEITVNGQVLLVPTAKFLPAYAEGKSMGLAMRWHDLTVSKEWIKRGANEIVFRMAPNKDKKPDDYLYLGIDNSVPGGRSWLRPSDKSPWRQDQLNMVAGTKGEYMVRLYLLRGPRQFQAVWRRGEPLKDSSGVIQYAGTDSGPIRVEWDTRRIDLLSPFTLTIETADAQLFDLFWMGADGQFLSKPSKARGPRLVRTFEPDAKFVPVGIRIPAEASVKSVAISGAKDYHPLPAPIDLCPTIARPAGKLLQRKPTCRKQGDAIELANDNLRCRFDTSNGRLRLMSLYNELAAAEMVRRPDDVALFLVEVDGKRFAGSRDFVCRGVKPSDDGRSFSADLVCPEIGMEARLTARAAERLELDLVVTNRAAKPVDFKLAFPHLAGLAIGASVADDYYYFPLGGGIIADTPTIARQGYGDHQALYQVMDLFSPQRGAGLAVWTADAEGRHKVLALRKHVPGRAPIDANPLRTPTAPEFLWTNPLEEVPGVGLAYEYLRRTRKPGQTFAPAACVLWAHPGDWHAALEAYVAWCRTKWKFRPYPSRLGPVIDMVAAGWGKGVLFVDGKYRDDIVKPRYDCVELMSWWEWSPLGPWSTPFDKLDQVLTPDKIKRWSPYFVTDPVTGKQMFNNQPGDYDGYNQRFGGLPALGAAIEKYKKAGAMVTLYTDPIRCDDATKLGRAHGKQWGVIQPDGKYVTNYEVWNMCHDVAEYRQWVADAMRRVMRETGADGIRLDEYGHRGWACFSKLHQHTFAEWGCTEWQRAIAETSRLVHQAMDEVKPDAVLTTEHPGYDYLLQFLDGCITYDLTVMASPLRPLECNTQRFYFPECKAYELDHRGADRKHWKRFWNGVASFGACYHEPMYRVLKDHADVFAGRDCRPLAPTLQKYVYANRFSGGGKTVYMLYNATGHSVCGPLLHVDVPKGHRLVDLLNDREIKSHSIDGRTVAGAFIPRDEVLCVGILPAEAK